MKLGAFSTSLNVKDLVASRDFYLKLGFEVFAGDLEMNYLILKSGDTVIGLFQGMFEGNLLTFNPGWDQNAENTEDFDDVRDIEKSLKENGIEIIRETDDSTEGPANFVVADPDGNVILIDQHR